MLVCIKCQQPVPSTVKSVKYCSLRCSTLYLKAQWRKRRRETVRAYARRYRKLGKRHLPRSAREKVLDSLGAKCARCQLNSNDTEILDVHHIKPLVDGGTNEIMNLMLFCKPCHREWHKRLTDFWKYDRS